MACRTAYAGAPIPFYYMALHEKCKRPACTNARKPCYNKKRNGPIAGPCEKGTGPAMEKTAKYSHF